MVRIVHDLQIVILVFPILVFLNYLYFLNFQELRSPIVQIVQNAHDLRIVNMRVDKNHISALWIVVSALIMLTEHISVLFK